MSSFRPLLAEKVDLTNLQYPVLASPKYDGYRCVIDGSRNPMSRNLKPISNAFVFGKLRELDLPKMDGELLTFTGGKVDEFSAVQSKLSSRAGMPDFKFMVFDDYSVWNSPYETRNSVLAVWFDQYKHRPGVSKYLEHVKQVLIDDEEQLLDFEANCLALGWEGVMVRSVDGHYKYGRSTIREGILLKLKRFFDDEAVVIEAHELLHNANEATINALGYTERSSHKDNFVGRDMLGKFTVSWKGVEFDIGTGFNEAQRVHYWSEAGRHVGKKLTFKYQSLGPNGKPRFPVFLGFRHD